MPLMPGSSEEVIAHNIEIEREANRPQKQAVAIALHNAALDTYMGNTHPDTITTQQISLRNAGYWAQQESLPSVI